MLRHNLLKIIGIVLLVLLLAIPFVIPEYFVFVLITLMIYMVVVVSFRLIILTGCWSLAHIPMMGVGAYTVAIIATRYGLPFLVTLLLGGLVSMVVGMVLSFPLAKVKGFAFFIASYAFGEAIRLIWTRVKNPFGGHIGISGIPSAGTISFFGLGKIDFSRSIPYYFLTLVVVALSLFIMHKVEMSRIGDTFKAVNSDESLSRSIGINILGYKRLSFMIGCLFAGIGGVLFSYYYRFVDPASFGMVNTMYLIIWTIVGGSSTFFGPIIGITALTFLSEFLRGLEEWIPLVYGVVLILALRFMPDGLESLPTLVRTWRIKKKTATAYNEEVK
ncbi:MAG: branched-chain amino acid ABC transporter permease [Deltaproteobacteria bacterium]|nr:branched-chain amino acid ABC transporter permease [Deltaproteobacteria bacterium]